VDPSATRHACISADVLADFVAGRLAATEVERVEAAIDGCALCRAALGGLAREAEGSASGDRAGGRQTGGEGSLLAGASIEAIPDPRIGSLIGGRYRVEGVLGRGGMGAVYAAEHVLIKRPVAIKVLHVDLASSSEVVRRFRNEARAAAAIGHPGIVEALDVGRTDEGLPFLVLERLEGIGLEQELEAQGSLPIARAARIALAIADALAAAHARGIIHRDLKPANVFLCAPDHERVKVLDFGISKIHLATGPATRTGAMMGTPHYMAPEQWNDAASVGPTADVWSLGVLLYRAISGELPFEGRTLPSLLAAITTRAPVPIRTRVPGIPDPLAIAIHRALAPRPIDRFPSMEAFAGALRPFATAPPASRGSTRPSASPSAERAVTLLCADGVVDASALAEAVRARHGRPLAARIDGGEWIAAFGQDTWSGDEVARALDAARSATHSARRIVIAPGRLASADGEPGGAAIELARAAAARDLEGVWIAAAVDPRASGGGAPGELVQASAEAPAPRSPPGIATALWPLLGRDSEVARLRAVIETARDERTTQLATIVGPPGIGKSRLVAAIAPIAEELEADCWAARADPREATSTLAAIRAAIESHVAGLAGSDRRSRAAAIDALARGSVREGDDALSRTFLAELLGESASARAGGAAPSPALEAARRSPRLMQDRLRLVAIETIASVARHRPLLLIIEDAQWADPTSIAVLHELSERAGLALAIVLTARDDAAIPGIAGIDRTELRLRGLRLRDVDALARAILGRPLPAPIVQATFDRTGGNPFFAAEILRALPADAGDVTLAELPLPPTLEGAVQARLDALTDEEREVCGLGAVLGDPIAPPVLAAMGVPDPELALSSLAAREIVRRRADGDYAFRAPLFAEVVYALLGADARRAAHRAAAEHLEEARDPAHETIARHLEHGGAPERAAVYYARAALGDRSRADIGRVLRCATRALELGAPAGDVHALSVARAEALEVLGQRQEQLGELERAIETAHDVASRAASRTERAVCLQRLGRSDEALAVLEVAVDEAESAADPETLARALGKRSAALVYAGKIDEAARVLLRAERLVMTRAFSLRAEAAVWRAQLAAATGDLGDRRNAYWAAAELYGEEGDLRSRAGADVNLADAYNRVGAYEEAETALRSALDACRRLGMRVMEGYALANLAYALSMSGRQAPALEAVDAARAIAQRTGEERLSLYAHLYRARILLASEDRAGALTEARALIAAAEDARHAPLRALAATVAAQAALALGLDDDALALATEAVALRASIGGMEEDEAEIFLAHALALERAGRVDEARAARARGRAIVETIGSRIGDPEWRERFRTDVAAHRALLGPEGSVASAES
jgi:tetratricopeptide (TPR) repeat protein